MPRFSKIEVEEILAHAKNLGKERFEDTIAPERPKQPVVSLHAQMVIVTCKQNTVKSTDLKGFEIWRNTTNTSQTAVKVGWVDCAPTQDYATWADTSVQPSTTYYYWTIARDIANNASAFSPCSASVFVPAFSGAEVPVPDAPTNISLSTATRMQDDGTLIAYIDGTYVASADTLMAKIEFGTGVDPQTWTAIGSFATGGLASGTFHHEPVQSGEVYTYKITSINTGGVSSSTSASIVACVDTTVPEPPTISGVGNYTHIAISIVLSNPPPDLAGFRLYRNTTNSSTGSTFVGSVTSVDGNAEYSDHSVSQDVTYYYFAKSFDKSGNLSSFSASSGALILTEIVLNTEPLAILTPADSMNTDPYFMNPRAWSSDLIGTAANADCFVSIENGRAGAKGFRTPIGVKALFGVNLDNLIPFDGSRKYTLNVFLRASTEGSSNAIGFVFYDADKQRIGYLMMTDVTVMTEWDEYHAAFATPPEGAAFFGPVLHLNSTEKGDTIIEVQRLRVREVLTSDILIANEAIITSAIQIAMGIIGNAHIANLDAEKITSGILDTARLSAAVAAVSQLTALGKNLIEDPSFLDFQNSFAMSGTATEAVVGRWTIAGDAAIPTNGVGVLTAASKPTLVMTGKGIKLRPFAASSGNRLWLAQNVTVKPNEPYCFSAHVTRDDTVPTDVIPPYDLIIEWRTASEYISQVAGSSDAAGRFYITGTAPANATCAVLYVMLPAHTPVSGYGANMVISAVQFERGSAATFWVGREQGTVTADRIFTGLLRSLNYSYESGDFSTDGTMIDLNTGVIQSKKFAIDSGGNARFAGDISGASGSFSGEIRAGATVVSPSGGWCGLGSVLGGFTGQIKIYISNYSGISDAPSNMVSVKMTLPGTVIEFGCSLNVKNGWDTDCWKNVLVGDTANERLKLRFYRSDGTPNKYYIVIGETTTNWGWGYAAIIEAAFAQASISTGSVSGTIQQTLAS